ncbi:AtpZ/AtpI family protein [Candidatus Uhrbacteria bacterium]|nr:AtpZ/AtpI family protein [Candidatus Uhrbacteria bacterium]
MDEKIQQKKPDGLGNYYRFAAKTFFQLTGLIAPPAVLGAFLGSWLDKRFDTWHWFLILCVAASFLGSMVAVRRKTRALGEEFKDMV